MGGVGWATHSDVTSACDYAVPGLGRGGDDLVWHRVGAAGPCRAPSRAGPAVLRHPAYLAGLACDGLAWAAKVVAMWRLPLFTVEAILAGSLAVTILIGIPALGLRPTRWDWLGVALTCVGVGVVSVAAGPERSASPEAGLRWALLATLLATLLVAALSYPRGGMVLQGLVAGLGYGLSAVFVRVTMQLSAQGTSWLVIPELYLACWRGGAGW